MSYYKVDLNTGYIESLERYVFQSEGEKLISPQTIITNHPKIILDIPEIEIQNCEDVLVAREYSTSRGSIDVLMITSNSDILIIETKLLRNPESHRVVVAQTIDYAKAFYNEDLKDLFDKLSKNKSVNKNSLNKFKNDDFWIANLEKNIRSGNFRIIILGDKIHPNVLGMVESIQSAPHMAFTIYLIEIEPIEYDKKYIIISPKVVANTVEIERSVIRIQIDHDKKSHLIESETPKKEGMGTRPILSPTEFLDKLTKQEFRETIQKFWDDWRKIGGDIKFGTSGFSLGINLGNKRIPFQFIYYNRIPTISETWRNNINIPDDLYQEYKENLKRSQVVYDGYCIGNKVEVPFSDIEIDDLKVILNAALNLAKKMMNR